MVNLSKTSELATWRCLRLDGGRLCHRGEPQGQQPQEGPHGFGATRNVPSPDTGQSLTRLVTLMNTPSSRLVLVWTETLLCDNDTSGRLPKEPKRNTWEKRAQGTGKAPAWFWRPRGPRTCGGLCARPGTTLEGPAAPLPAGTCSAQAGGPCGDELPVTTAPVTHPAPARTPPLCERREPRVTAFKAVSIRMLQTTDLTEQRRQGPQTINIDLTTSVQQSHQIDNEQRPQKQWW